MKIVCYGDSNTWGHNPVDGNRYEDSIRWPKILQDIRSEDEIIEEGLCGRCAAFMDTVKPYRHAITTLRMILETHQPIDVFVLMLGTNDLKACNHPNAIAITNGIKEMLQMIKNKYHYNLHMTPPKILLVSPIHIHEAYQKNERIAEQFDQQSYDVSFKLASYYQELAIQFDCDFLDASKYAQASTFDGIHMDEANHKKFAHAINEKLSNL